MGGLKERFSRVHFGQAALCSLAFSFCFTVVSSIQQPFLSLAALPSSIGMHNNAYAALEIEWSDAGVSLNLSPEGQTYPLCAYIEQWEESSRDSIMV